MQFPSGAPIDPKECLAHPKVTQDLATCPLEVHVLLSNSHSPWNQLDACMNALDDTRSE